MDRHNLSDVAFPVLSESQIAALEKFATLRSFSDGEILFEVGESEFNFYIIKTGKVKIIKYFAEQEKTIVVHEAGEFMGEMSLLTGTSSPVSAIAVSECEVYEISADKLRSILREKPKLGDQILQAFISRRKMLEKSEFGGLQIIGSESSEETFRIRDFLSKNRIPFNWIDIEKDQQVNQLFQEFEFSKAEIPLVISNKDLILKNPSNLKLGEVLGLKKSLEETVYDLAIVGAGPAGLAASVYGASEGLSTVLLEKTAPGGQASCSSKIENYMGFPLGLSGRDLADRAIVQAQKFGVKFSIPTEVVKLEFKNSHKVLRLASGENVSSKCVLISTGVTYRKLDLSDCEKFEGCGVYYSATAVEAQMCHDNIVIIVGGGNSAGQAAVFLSQYAKQILLLIRGEDLGKSMSQYLLQRVKKNEKIKVLINTEISKMNGNEVLCSIEIINNKTKQTETIKTTTVFIFIGAIPHTNWLPPEIEVDKKGFIKTGSLVQDSDFGFVNRQPFLLETSYPGIFAAGDVRLVSIKRVASAVGEGSMTVHFVHQLLSS